MQGSFAFLPVLDSLPFALQVPLLGAAVAALAWLSLQLVASRLRPGSLARGLVLRSRLSISCTILLSSLLLWLARGFPRILDLGQSDIDPGTAVVVIGVVWTILRCKRELLRKADAYTVQVLPSMGHKERLFLADVVDKLLTLLVGAILAFVVMRLLGLSAAVLLTAGGFGAAALGFGARTLVENGLSGASLYLNRPFVVGDVIRLPSEDILGDVEAIGWFYTRLRDPDRQPVYIPNGLFSNQIVQNIAQIDNRRVWIEFGLRYEDRVQITAIVAALEAALKEQKHVDPDRPAVVHFTGFGESSLDLRLMCFCDSGVIFDAWALQQSLLLLIGQVVEDHGAGMPFPTRTLLGEIRSVPDAGDHP